MEVFMLGSNNVIIEDWEAYKKMSPEEQIKCMDEGHLLFLKQDPVANKDAIIRFEKRMKLEKQKKEFWNNPDFSARGLMVRLRRGLPLQ
jgi:hypothetical protein